MSILKSSKSVKEIISSPLSILTVNKVVVTILQRVFHRQVEHWEPVRMRKGECGIGCTAQVSGRGVKLMVSIIFVLLIWTEVPTLITSQQDNRC